MSYLFLLFFLFTLLILIMWTGGRCTLRIFGFNKDDWNPGLPPLRTPPNPSELPSSIKTIHVFAMEVTVGFAVLGTLWVWLLLCGQFNRRSLLAALLVLVIATLWLHAPRLQRKLSQKIDLKAELTPLDSAPSGRLGKGHLNDESRSLITALSTFELAVGVLIGLALVVLALYPYQGYDFRAYQMPMAAGYAETGGWQWFGDLRFPTFPPLMNLWFAIAILLGGNSSPVLAQLLALLPLFLLVSLCTAWAREKGAPFPTLAAALLLGSPLLIWAGTFGFIDLTMALFTTLALYCLNRFQSSQSHLLDSANTALDRDSFAAKHLSPSSPGPRYRWLVLSGVMVGSAMNVKYLGAFFAPFILAWITGSWLISRSIGNSKASATAASSITSLLKSLATFSLPAIAIASPWYLKTWFATGNPVFPFAKTVFGPNPWGWSLAISVEDATRAVASLGASLQWDSVNPWLLLVLPFALLFLLKATRKLWRPPKSAQPRSTVLLETASLSYLVFALALSEDHRYILPSAALLAILGATYSGAAIDYLSTFVRQHQQPRGLQRFLETVFPKLLSMAFVALGMGFLGHTLLVRGSLPPAPSQYEAHVLDQARGLEALRWAQEDYGASTIYRFGLNDLTVFSRSTRTIGDSSGPYSTLLLTAGLADRDNTAAEKLIAQKLREWDVDIILEERCGKSISAAARQSMFLETGRRPMKAVPIPTIFEFVHSIDDVCAYRLRDP